ncbi:MAG TPA: DUF5317 family protein [Candidatus Dormibacteraeota bacterium]|nr:DUF5317 family protein [Candidatus Dormibacteraeota bacterium]
MLLVGGLAIGLAIGIATGGKLGHLSTLRFRWPYFVLGVLLIKEVVLVTPLNRVDGAQLVYAASLAALVGWTIWNINLLPGVWLVSAGAALNLVVVLANGGRMPVARELAARGSHLLIDRGFVGQYVLMGPHTNLNWLADWMALPGPLAVVPEAYSPGDLVVTLGIAVVAFLATRRSESIPRGGETSGRIVSDPP